VTGSTGPFCGEELPTPTSTLVTRSEQIPALQEALAAIQTVGLDLETTGLNPRAHLVWLLSLATPDHVWIVDCFKLDPRPLFPILATRSLIGHNIGFDLGFLAEMGFPLGSATDTMILSRLLRASGETPAGVAPLSKPAFRAWWAEVRREGVQLRDDDGRREAAFRRPPDTELIELLEELDRDVLALWELYALLSQRAALAFSGDDEGSRLRLYEFGISSRDFWGITMGAMHDGPRHQWAMILECSVHSLSGQPARPLAPNAAAYRVLAGREVSDEAYLRGAERLVWITRRRRRAIDPYGPRGPHRHKNWIWPVSDDELIAYVRDEFLTCPDVQLRLAGPGEEAALLREKFSLLLGEEQVRELAALPGEALVGSR
jgi:hypothetical protein